MASLPSLSRERTITPKRDGTKLPSAGFPLKPNRTLNAANCQHPNGAFGRQERTQAVWAVAHRSIIFAVRRSNIQTRWLGSVYGKLLCASQPMNWWAETVPTLKENCCLTPPDAHELLFTRDWHSHKRGRARTHRCTRLWGKRDKWPAPVTHFSGTSLG